MSVKHSIVRLGLESLYFSGAHVLLRPLVGGVGAILMLHHVRLPRRDRFQSNKQLEVTPEFLARVIRRLQCMDWREIGELARNPQVTIGAHTVNHPMLAKTSEGAVRTELKMSRAVIAAALGKAPDHLAYPYGDPTTAGTREFRIAAELGFKTAVTTRPGVLFGEHADHLTALPRVSLNSSYQDTRYIPVLMSGAATALWNGFRRVDAA